MRFICERWFFLSFSSSVRFVCRFITKLFSYKSWRRKKTEAAIARELQILSVCNAIALLATEYFARTLTHSSTIPQNLMGIFKKAFDVNDATWHHHHGRKKVTTWKVVGKLSFIQWPLLMVFAPTNKNNCV